VNDDLQRWAETWERAARAISRVDAANAVDAQAAVLQLMPAFRLAREALPQTRWSGLVVMRRLLDGKHG
jgi:hypothetical protein